MLIATPDGRSLQVYDAGGDGVPCLFHHGTPGSAVPSPQALRIAADLGLRWITYARPGYGDSTPLAGRTVAQAATDSASVLDALGVGDFVTYGWSGGGPHALACAVLLPDRCRAAASVAGAAPNGQPDLDFTAGMGEENVEEFGFARQGRQALAGAITPWVGELRVITGDGVAAAFGGLVSEVDKAALSDEVADAIATSFREALRVGADGWLDDDLAFVRPWGFAPEDIRVPVAVWQGEQDLMVPLAHGQWLAAHLPGATVQFLPEHGHISLAFQGLEPVLRELSAKMGR